MVNGNKWLKDSRFDILVNREPKPLKIIIYKSKIISRIYLKSIKLNHSILQDLSRQRICRRMLNINGEEQQLIIEI